jgi:hypothetical protein
MKKYAAIVNPAELRDHLNIIASDALEGRYTGSRGQKMAAAFIANHFQEVGLQPPVNGSYYQTVPLYLVKPGYAYLTVNDTRIENYTDMVYVGDDQTGGEVKSEILFAGLGRPEDLDQLDVKGKAVLILVDKIGFTAIRQMRTTSKVIREKGAKYILVASGSTSEEFDKALAQLKNWLGGGNLTLEKPDAEEANGVFYVKSSIAEKIFKTSFDKLKATADSDSKKKSLKKVKPGMVSFQTTLESTEIKSENVLGYLPGTDKKDELIVVTAHFDHIGKRSSGTGDIINNGADDDGSGTVAVMLMAKAFARAKKDGVGPRRSMLFMTVTGEEEGLLGSQYYTSNPVFPLANTVVDLNIDMIGRTDEKYKDNKNYVYVIGADKLSSELHTINEQMNSTYTHLTFDYLYNDEKHPDRLYYRSDHWNFAKNNVPIIFYFDGIHEDYHKVTDQVEKIDFDLLATRAQAVFYTAWEIANRDERIKVDKK